MSTITLSRRQLGAIAWPLGLMTGTARGFTLSAHFNGIKVTGWIEANHRAAGFKACADLAAIFGRASIGAWISPEENGTINAPFEFVVEPIMSGKPLREETRQQTADRIVTLLKTAINA